MTARRYAYALLPLLAALLALTFFLVQQVSPAEAQQGPSLTNFEVWDEYGNLRVRPQYLNSR